MRRENKSKEATAIFRRYNPLIVKKEKRIETTHRNRINEKPDTSVEEKQRPKKNSFVKEIGKFLAFGAIGFGAGQLAQIVCNSIGAVGTVALTITIGVAVAVGSKLLGKKGKSIGNMSTAVSLDFLASEFVFASMLGSTGILSNMVAGPFSGMAVGATVSAIGYVIGAIIFCGGWGLMNLNKYKRTGFGSMKDLAKFPKEVAKTVREMARREPIDKTGNVHAESYLSECAELHGKFVTWSTPYYVLRIAAGLLAGFAPTAFMATFLAVQAAVAGYIFPIYINFYRSIKQRINSEVMEANVQESFDKIPKNPKPLFSS